MTKAVSLVLPEKQDLRHVDMGSFKANGYGRYAKIDTGLLKNDMDRAA